MTSFRSYCFAYILNTLEAQLGLSLFDRRTTRKPKLTPQGEAVVSEASAVAHSVETLRARVRGFLDATSAWAKAPRGSDRFWRAPWKGGAFQWVQAPPGNRSSRKQSEQSWR
jgi:DNA-binding transcriptional LysR family regulator